MVGETIIDIDPVGAVDGRIASEGTGAGDWVDLMRDESRTSPVLAGAVRATWRAAEEDAGDIYDAEAAVGVVTADSERTNETLSLRRAGDKNLVMRVRGEAGGKL